MTNKLFVLKDVADFAPGAFENTTVENGSIQLGRGGGGYLPAGTYTSVPLLSQQFKELIPSWNADTPPGTAVEVQARIGAGGRWSRWFSFGRWSPFVDRGSPEPYKDDIAQVNGHVLALSSHQQNADTAQLRINLYTNDSTLSPAVHLLSVSTDADTRIEGREPTGYRTLEIPAYSCLVRDPSLSGRMACATSLAMLMNRWGKDVLPEEVARSCFDSTFSNFGNLSFLSALGGAYGFECYAGYGNLHALRREVWRGSAVAAMVHYRAPSLGEPQTEIDDIQDALPVFEGAATDSNGHLLVVRGFENQKGEEMVMVNDPIASNNEQVRKSIPLKQFLEIFIGHYLVLHRSGRKGAGKAKPVRVNGNLELDGSIMRMRVHEKPLETENHASEQDQTKDFRTTFCYTLTEEVAYASAAQKQFYYPQMMPDEWLRFDRNAAIGKKLTFYRIGPLGTTWVAEKNIQPDEETQLLIPQNSSEGGNSNDP